MKQLPIDSLPSLMSFALVSLFALGSGGRQTTTSEPEVQFKQILSPKEQQLAFQQQAIFKALFPSAPYIAAINPYQLSEMVVGPGLFVGSTPYGAFEVSAESVYPADLLSQPDNVVAPEVKQYVIDHGLEFAEVLGTIFNENASREFFGMAMSRTLAGNTEIQLLVFGNLAEIVGEDSTIQGVASGCSASQFSPPATPPDICPGCSGEDRRMNDPICIQNAGIDYQADMALACVNHATAIENANDVFDNCMRNASVTYAACATVAMITGFFTFGAGAGLVGACVVTLFTMGSLCDTNKAAAIAIADNELNHEQQVAGINFDRVVKKCCMPCPAVH